MMSIEVAGSERVISARTSLVEGYRRRVVVGDDHVTPAIGADVALRGNVAGLLGMAGIPLLHRNSEQKPRIADFVRPRRGDAGHAGLFDFPAQQRRAHDGAPAADFIRRPLPEPSSIGSLRW